MWKQRHHSIFRQHHAIRDHIPTVIWHLWSVKGWGASPNLVLPKVMPADVHGTVDMEKVPWGAFPPIGSPWLRACYACCSQPPFARIMAGIGQNTGAIIAAAFILLFLGTMFIALWR